MLTNDEVGSILRPVFAEMGAPVSDADLFDFWLKSRKSNEAFCRSHLKGGLFPHSIGNMYVMVGQCGIIASSARERPVLTHAGNIICLKVSHLLRLLYGGILTFLDVWARLIEFASSISGNYTPVLFRRALLALIYKTHPYPLVDETPALPVKPAPPPTPKPPPPDLVYAALIEDLDREDAGAARRVKRSKARRRNRARRIGVEPPAYVNAVALGFHSVPSEQSAPAAPPPPPYA